MEKYLHLFRDETLEYLEKLNDLLDRLNRQSEPHSAFREMFRLAHSIKGMAASLGLQKTANLAHRLEDLFSLLKNTPSPELPVTLIREAFSLLEKCAREGEENFPESQIDTVMDKLEQVLQQYSAVDVSEDGVQDSSLLTETPLVDELAEISDEEIADIHKETTRKIEGTIQLVPETRLPSARWMIILRELEKYGQIEFTDPDQERIRRGEAGMMLRLVLNTDRSLSEITQAVKRLTDVQQVSLRESVVSESSPETETFDQLMPTTIRVELEAVDRYFQLAQALFMQVQRIRNAVLQWAGSRLSMEEEILLRDTETLARQLYLNLIQLRMLPLSVLVNPLKRMVENLAPRLGKKARLITRGEELTLDKAILEQMLDCFIHMVRNSLDHGIETPEIRRQRGKPETGYISIHAQQEGEWLQITVLDDGQGMDLEKIAQVALERGVVTEKALRKMNAEEIAMLVTMPGFSTASEVTDLSGRGVGMDVVRHRVESLGGTMRIETRRGRGTKIVLRLPSRLAILDTMIIRYRQYHLALPLERIVRIESFNHDRLHYRERQPMWYIDEMIAPLVTIDQVLGEHEPLRPEQCLILTLFFEEGIYALGVPRILGEYRSVVQRLELPLSRLPLFSGITVSPDLEVIPLLDTEYLGRIILQTRKTVA